jgi:hypothetical protein
MTTKSIHERYADAALSRVIERPRDELEEQYAQEEAQAQAKAIWSRFGNSENHRRRVITLLAQEALKGMPSPSKQVADQDFLDE